MVIRSERPSGPRRVLTPTRAPLSVVARPSDSAAAVASGSVLFRPGFVSHGGLLPNASAADPFAKSL